MKLKEMKKETVTTEYTEGTELQGRKPSALRPNPMNEKHVSKQVSWVLQGVLE